MNNLKEYITEKLILNKDIIGNQPNKEDYWFGDIDDPKEIKKEFYEKRKLKRKTNDKGELKNKPWFAVYLYLKKNGPSKRQDIVNALWGKDNKLGRFFGAMSQCNIIYSDKGYATLCGTNTWRTSGIKFDELTQ